MREHRHGAMTSSSPTLPSAMMKPGTPSFSRARTTVLEFQVRVSKTAEGLPAVAPDQPSSDATSAEQPELSPIPPVDIVMSNFISHKIGGDSWDSPAFYSHTGGYKMCLRVDANGEGSGEGTHVFVCVYLMQGRYDRLIWPFRGDITFSLVNQGMDKGHVEKTVPLMIVLLILVQVE